MNDRIYYSEEAAKPVQRDKVLLALLVAGLGVGVGTVIGLLFAPHSGEKTRRKLGKQVSNTVDKGRTAAESTGEQIQANVSKARDVVRDRIQERTG